jgi:hypothetical protein
MDPLYSVDGIDSIWDETNKGAPWQGTQKTGILIKVTTPILVGAPHPNNVPLSYMCPIKM